MIPAPRHPRERTSIPRGMLGALPRGTLRALPRSALAVPRSALAFPTTSLLVLLLPLVLLVAGPVAGEAAVARAAVTDDDVAPSSPAEGTWVWPVAGARAVERAFVPPTHAYGAGHRGVDLTTAAGSDVSAPADGTVLFAGPVAGRSVVTIDHGGGVVSSFDPVVPFVARGDPVGPGTVIGRLQDGDAMHCPGGCVHVGVRVDGAYVDPLPFFVRRERSVLLPLAG